LSLSKIQFPINLLKDQHPCKVAFSATSAIHSKLTHYRTTKYFADGGDELAAKLQRVAAQGTDAKKWSTPQDLSTTNPPKPASIQHIRLSYQFLSTSYN
jgi:hypothetical protein